MTAVMIANGRANWGAGRRTARRAIDFLRREGFAFSLRATKYPGHVEELAAQAAAQGADPVIVAGGDGTINETVNGLLRSGQSPLPRLGVIPCGSSNDLSKSLGIPQHPQEACRVIVRGEVREVDVGQAQPGGLDADGGTSERLYHFCSASCLGYFAEVAAGSLKMKRLRGSLRYVLPALGVIRKMTEGWKMSITADGQVLEGEYAVLLIGNAPRFGGLTMLPGARPDDGMLDCLLVEMPGKWEALHLVPLVYRRALEHHRKVTRFRTASLSVTLHRPTRVCNDGEMLPAGCERIDYRVLPRRLRVLC